MTPGLEHHPGERRERDASRPSNPSSRRVPLFLDGQEGRLPHPPRLRWLVLLPTFALFAAHAASFGPWQIDDAGISFAYARNLAQGHGLVAQPGVAPVEGYSNPLWVFLLAAFQAVRLFDPLWTPKLLSLGLGFGTFALLDRMLAQAGVGAPLSAVALALLALQSGFAIWMVSGLENPLYACLFVGLALLSLREIQQETTPRNAIAAGLLAAGLALTRPEGALFAALFPFVLVLSSRRRLSRLGFYLGAFALPVGIHLAIRLAWFGAWVPNTFYAKGGPTLATLGGLAALDSGPAARAFTLLRATFGKPGAWVGVAALLAIGYRLGRGRLRPATSLLLIATLFAALPYLLLPLDWMPEYRFATPFFPAILAFGAVLATDLDRYLPTSRHLVGALTAVALAVSVLSSTLPRSRQFAARPTVPFATVEQRYGRDYDRFADLLQVRRGSILVPDVGGTLWRSRLTVYDLGGLCNRTIAKTLGKDDPAFHDYVFGTLKPTFIHTHQYWTVRAKLDSDPRFARDYLPLFEVVEPYVTARSKGKTLRSGDFVRREAAEGRPEAVIAIRHELAASYALERKAASGRSR